ncbi:hypothetical protein NA57DRAFT_52092 [Rhizodiscina lignyota]|uniref:Uncharacterized protein n=1 Tax=Rhizodiscina lignyota TaxID=1504668 RepID=A0A9P4IJY4_9PEZI|nr:hypothetical protein NA57DRAFT_52092 [Rhizodiscina lignyota]
MSLILKRNGIPLRGSSERASMCQEEENKAKDRCAKPVPELSMADAPLHPSRTEINPATTTAKAHEYEPHAMGPNRVREGAAADGPQNHPPPQVRHGCCSLRHFATSKETYTGLYPRLIVISGDEISSISRHEKMRSTKSPLCKTFWLYASVAIILFAFSILESFKGGLVIRNHEGEVAEPVPLDRRQAVNGTTDTTSAVSSSSTSTDSTTVVVATTSSPVATTTTGASQPASSDSGTGSTSDSSSGSDSSSDDSGSGASTPASTAAGSSDSDDSSSSGTTAAAAAGAVATGSSSTDSNSDSSSSGDSGSSQPASNGDSASTTSSGDSDSSSGSSGDSSSGSSGDSSSGSSDNSGDGDSSGSAPTDNSSNSDGSSSSGSSSGDDSGGSSGAASGGGAASGSNDENGSGTAGSSGSDAPAQTEAPITSIGKPTTLPPTTMVSSEQIIMTTTNSEGKPTFTTSHFKSTFVTTPVSTPSTVITPTPTSQSSPTGSAAGAVGNKDKASGGLSTGGKVALGIFIPLIAIAAGIGIATFLMKRRKKMEEDSDSESEGRRNISGPIPVAGPNDPRNRFSSLRAMDSENPDHAPVNSPTLPSLRTPQMSMIGGPESLMKTGPAARASAAVASSIPPPRPPPPSATLAAAPAPVIPRSTSVHSAVSSVSAYSRYSDDSRSPSPPPPLPEIPQAHNPFLDPSEVALLNTPLNPFEVPEEKRPKTAGSLSFASGHPSRAPSKAPSRSTSAATSKGPSRAVSTKSYKSYRSYGIPDNVRDRPFSDISSDDESETTTTNLSRISAISDASVADARATQLYYPFGETVMTPGGRIVPRPVGPNPNNINPGLGGMRPDGSHSGAVRLVQNPAPPSVNVGFNNTPISNQPKLPVVAVAPNLPQVSEREEEDDIVEVNQNRASSPITGMNGAPILPNVFQDTGFSFDFGQTSPSTSPTGDRPSTSPEPTRSTHTSSPSPPPNPPSIPVERSAPGGRPRAPSVGYRQYRANNLIGDNEIMCKALRCHQESALCFFLNQTLASEPTSYNNSLQQFPMDSDIPIAKKKHMTTLRNYNFAMHQRRMIQVIGTPGGIKGDLGQSNATPSVVRGIDFRSTAVGRQISITPLYTRSAPCIMTRRKIGRRKRHLGKSLLSLNKRNLTHGRA